LVVTPLAVFGFVPEAPLVTGIETVQDPAAGMVIPENVRVPLAPAAKVFEPAPAQVPVAAPAEAICMFASKSVKLAPVRATLLAFVSVKVSVVVAPCDMGLAENASEMDGAVATTSRAVFDAAPVPASALEMPLVAFG
jgi:hypothetical protein